FSHKESQFFDDRIGQRLPHHFFINILFELFSTSQMIVLAYLTNDSVANWLDKKGRAPVATLRLERRRPMHAFPRLLTDWET
ncbi:hypothetical protein PMAYCL1PPCAC_20213, partial [Pristionchus mayeri]